MSKEIIKFILNQGEKAISNMSKPKKDPQYRGPHAKDGEPEPKHLRKTVGVTHPK